MSICHECGGYELMGTLHVLGQQLLLSLHILWAIWSPVPGIGSCSPGAVSKTLAFKLGRRQHRLPTLDILKPLTSLSNPWHLMGIKAQAEQSGSAHRYSPSSMQGSEAASCPCDIQQSSMKILQVAGISQQFSQASYLKDLSHCSQSQLCSGPCPGNFSALKKKLLGTQNQHEITLKILQTLIMMGKKIAQYAQNTRQNSSVF